MRPMRIRTPALVALVIPLLLLAACGNNEVDAAVTATTTTTTTTASLTTTTTSEAPPAPAPVSPLTGQQLDPALMSRPIVAIKIDNVDGRSTPQAGINQADVVYEVQVEAQITRLLSLYQSSDVGPVGPVRSARTSEIGLLEELNGPLFAWHGANGILGPQVRASSVVPRSIEDVPHLYFRQGNRRAPYNSFVHGTAQIRETAPEGATAPPAPIFDFAGPGEAPSAQAVPASTVTIRFPPPFGRGGGEAPVRYDWNGSQWLRFQNGRPHLDASGRQVAVDNVIVRYVEALHSGTVDSAGTPVPTANVVSGNEVWVFSKGTVTTGNWNKAHSTSRTNYLDHAGNPIKLTPGKTWVSMPYASTGSSFG